MRASNAAINLGGKPFGYVGNGFSVTIPIISQCPVTLSLPAEASAMRPQPPTAWTGAHTSNGRDISQPQPLQRRQMQAADASATWGSVALSGSVGPYAAASGIAPTPQPSMTMMMTRRIGKFSGGYEFGGLFCLNDLQSFLHHPKFAAGVLAGVIVWVVFSSIRRSICQRLPDGTGNVF